MEVTFRRTGSHRYAIDVRRERFPDVMMDPAPGFDPYLPHDLVHFVVESETGLPQGVFGQLAKGGDAGAFRKHIGASETPRSARRQRRRAAKRGARLASTGHRDAVFSERAAVICEYEWMMRSDDPHRRREAEGRAPYVKRMREECSKAEAARLSPAVIDSVCETFDELSRRWRMLEVGEELTFRWPRS